MSIRRARIARKASIAENVVRPTIGPAIADGSASARLQALPFFVSAAGALSIVQLGNADEVLPRDA